MKRKNAVIASILAATLLLSLVGTVAFAWFFNSAKTNPFITSHIHKSYFESGDGTSATQYQTYDDQGNPVIGQGLTDDSGCAFEIKHPVQLYYFAWLQALGYFNMPNDGQNTINQVYFYLSDDLDMTGYVLPQIGTEEYPFVGNLDGNGHTISNLTVQNVLTTDGTTWTDAPVNAVSGNEIVGFFGVIGSLNNAGTVNAAVENGSSFTATPGYTYSSQVNEAKNFALDQITVKTETASSLMGIAAGYVNGSVSNVQVMGNASLVNNGATAALTDYTAHLSDYALSGYVTSAYKDTTDVVRVTVDTPTEANSRFNYTAQGASAGWGGSIDMRDMFTRITNVRNNVTTANSYKTERRVYDESGNLIGTYHSGNRTTDSSFRMYADAQDGSGSYLLSYVNNSSAFHYLAALYKDVTIVRRTSDTENAFYIKSGNTYLNVNNNHNGLTTTGTNTKWVLDASGHLRTTDDYGVFYLNYNGTALSLDETGSTVWTKTGNTALHCSSGYLQYVNGWTVRKDTDGYYTIASGGYYLNATDTDSLGTGNGAEDTPTHWIFSNPGSGNNGTIYTIIDGTRYYLRDATRNTGSLRLTNSASSATTWYWTNGSNARLSAGTSNSSRYVYLATSSGWFGSVTRTWQGSTDYQNLTITEYSGYTHADISLENTTAVKYEFSVVSEPDRYSYVPLSASNTSPFTVNSQNTGYIVGGSHETASDRKSDIRISRYEKSNISAGLTSTNAAGQVNDSNVRTVNASGIQTIDPSSFAKYDAAVNQFNTVLYGQTNVYGLHFMNAEISKDNLIVAPKVMLEGTEYENYQMPEDSIDFNVHQKGFINFFAGTYFSQNNSFFSLHTIERDADKNITAIKEIKQIWKSSDQSKDYIYYLKTDSGYEWSGTKTSDYSLAFNTDWITQPGTTNQLGTTSLYYFEIPVNEGEFALGSVEGRIGAYLLYLDIAANAQLVDRSTVTEDFEEVTSTYSFPVGMTFQNTPIPPASTDPVIPSGLASLETSHSGFDATVTDDTHLTFSAGAVNYIADGVTVNGSQTAANLSATPESVSTRLLRRVTYRDFNVAKNRYTVTEVVVEQMNGGAKSVTINAWNTDSDWDIEGANAQQIASMTEGFVPVIGGTTTGVAINQGESQALEYTEVDEEFCYLINVGAADDAQALRIECAALEDALGITDALYRFGYSIKDNDDAENGSSIAYDYNVTLALDPEVEEAADLYTYSNRGYGITVTAGETIRTRVITPVTKNAYTVSLTPTPS